MADQQGEEEDHVEDHAAVLLVDDDEEEQLGEGVRMLDPRTGTGATNGMATYYGELDFDGRFDGCCPESDCKC